MRSKIQEIEQLKLTIFGEAGSLEEARHFGETMCNSKHERDNLNAFADVFQNTLITKITKLLESN
ncbi:hypothetical protein BAE46_00945 [Glaciecola punicea]|uniref:hypothetical protein n=1 Tax=Glaciecola punicea TaxID=56804 RepID=UPI0008720BF2|nr:hypothetical protein [Glaciecola punicea]OFA33309.1 hypothetical protein BAE46_00945 [Glaciecola punicea]